MTKKKILISSRSFGKETDSNAVKFLKKSGFEVVSNPYDRTLKFNEFTELIEDSVGLIAGTEKITAKMLENAPSLRVISRYGVGIDNIDLDTANQKGIVVCNTPDAPTKAVAELVLGLMLNLSRKICEMNRNMHEGGWKRVMGCSINGKTLGVVGLGRIGKEVVNLVQPFGMEILAYEIFPDRDFVESNEIVITALEKLLSQSDIVSIHLPLTEETHNIIGAKELSLMKDDAFIINTARGGLIDENALIDALEGRHIGGVAVDAFDDEPYKGRLSEFDNAVLTPHIGSYTKETRQIMEMETVNNLISALLGVGDK